jgi:ketosteroid isomerase-like protein
VNNDNIQLVSKFYAAMRARDVAGIVTALDQGFVLRVSAGMPGGYGGDYTGAQQALAKVWGPVHAAYGAVPYPDELIDTGPDRVVAVGEYRGPTFSATFAHIIRVRDGRMTELHQITDTGSWPDTGN